ncbi:3-phosphoshikimate 1-carboxyvinyltransferase [uncultured Megasphaera sp.]|uniref:3-phosphoshikimate 1-carboxyvinyltransferase n=1 Tax=uncultured Megasphaera sp. TaxID=165188 RepID=UPI00265A0F12|nr:3-phosphoshikimate 1-carboxyvinyltransferase [uncultured Megasphaera sp.]
MNVVITPHTLQGTVEAPSSKSIGHRDLICAALADGESVVDNISPSQDIEATCQILQAFGADIQEIPSSHPGRAAYCVRGGLKRQDQPLSVNANESGSTLRFLIPVGILSGNTVTFHGQGRLAKRPLAPYYTIFDEKHIAYTTTDGALPLTVHGTLRPGRYALAGDVSSQFFTGLLMTLPLLSGDSHLQSTTPLESASYVNMTIDCLTQHGIQIDKDWNGSYHIPGNQQYRNGEYVVEGDYSQAAFWLSAGTLGKAICCTGLRPHSSQGDEVIVSIIRQMGGQIEGKTELTACPSLLEGRVIDVEDCPDLVPVLTVLATCSKGITRIINAGRVRLKECDRLHAIATELNKLGADVEEEPEGLIIHGVSGLTGGRVSGWNDHRIAMALAVASQRCSGTLVIEGAECVRKSYPEFWQDFASLGGIYRQED